jgi:hypothetical protein
MCAFGIASLRLTTPVRTVVNPPWVSTAETFRSARSRTHMMLPGFRLRTAGSSAENTNVTPSRLTRRNDRIAASRSIATVAGFHCTSKTLAFTSWTVRR